MVTDLPTGTVTYFFSDVQDSTGLLQRLGKGYKGVIERHAEIIRMAISKHQGVEVSTEGDSFFAAFESASNALEASKEIQLMLNEESWPDGGSVAVRIGLHTGTAELGLDNYVGIDVNRAARISAAGHGGQIVLSDAVRTAQPNGSYTDLGVHSLRGLERSEHLYQLDVAGLAQSFPPLRTQTSRPNNLPALTSHLVGRQVDLAVLQELINNNRLVTITGPGGVGKSRVALEVARKLAGQFDQGVFFVGLSSIEDVDLVLPTIASAVGVNTEHEDLAGHLSDGPRLLLLDNFEQVIGAAPAVGELLAGSAPLKLLVTSQVPLRLGEEKVYRLQPLPVGDNDSPAIELFATRAGQADPDFDLELDRQAVADLVAALDGVPLAIELAAARSNVLSPTEIQDRLGAGVLKTSRADAPQRHRSIEAAVEWSYGLLDSRQQRILQTMSVFRGGATLTSLMAVANTDPLDDLTELVERSLVEPVVGKVGKRFDLLASVQEFAAHRLEDHEHVVEQHARYFFELCRAAHQPMEGSGRAHWLAVLDDELDNIGVVLGHFWTGGQISEGQEMVGSIWRFFHSTGRLGELELWLTRLLGPDPLDDSTPAQARALVARAALHYWRAQWEECIADYEAAAAVAERVDAKSILAEALVGLSLAYGIARGHGLETRDPSEPLPRAREIYQEIDDPVGLANIDFNSTFYEALTATEPEPPSARTMLELLDKHPRGGTLLEIRVKLTMSETYIFGGEYESARLVTLEALGLAEAAGDVFYMGMVLRWLGVIAVEVGNPELGARLEGAGASAVNKAGGSFPPPIVPIDSALDRASKTLGEAAVTAFQAGRELPLIEAISLARKHLGDHD